MERVNQPRLIKGMMKQANLMIREVIEKAGFKSSGSVTNMTNKNYREVRIDTLLKIAEACDYEIVLRPKNGKDKESRSFIYVGEGNETKSSNQNDDE